jgi:hypothetical protein
MKQRFTDAGAGAQDVTDRYNSWSLKLSEICVQACYAIIAGLFAVFGTTGTLLSNTHAVASLVTVFIVLGANILVRHIIVGQLHRRIVFAENNTEKWNVEFNEYKKSGGQWPYTHSIDLTGKLLRGLSVWGVLLASGLLIIAVLHPFKNETRKGNGSTTNSTVAATTGQPAMGTNALINH